MLVVCWLFENESHLGEGNALWRIEVSKRPVTVWLHPKRAKDWTGLDFKTLLTSMNCITVVVLIFKCASQLQVQIFQFGLCNKIVEWKQPSLATT